MSYSLHIKDILKQLLISHDLLWVLLKGINFQSYRLYILFFFVVINISYHSPMHMPPIKLACRFWIFICIVLLFFNLFIVLISKVKKMKSHLQLQYNITNSNMPSFFRFLNKRASYPFGIISLAHAPVNVTDFSIGSINCNPNNADRGCSIIRVT